MFEFFKDLFKKEIPSTEFEAMFSRLDVDKFFQSLNHYYNPNDLVKKLGGIHKFELLTKDTDIGAALDKRLAALLDTKLTLQDGDQDLINLFNEELMPFERQLKQDFFWTVFNGYGVEQIIYNENGTGEIVGFQREQFWRFEPLPDLIHVKLTDTTNNEWRNKILPWGKWVLTTNNGTYYNPYGDPLAEKLIQPWLFKCNGWDLWMDFAKRFANGFMHAKIDDPTQKEDVRRALEKSGKSAILVTDKNSDLNLIQASRDSSIYTALNEKTIASINKAILGETLTTTMEQRGSSGAAEIHNEVRLEKTRSDISLVESAINEIMEQACAVRGIKGKKIPKAKLIFDPGLNADLAQRDAVLKGLGVSFNKKYFLTNYGLKEDEFEIKEETFPSLFSEKKRSFLKPEDTKMFLGIEPKHNCGKGRIKLADASLNRKANKSEKDKEDIAQVLMRNTSSPIEMDDLIAAIELSSNEKELDENMAKFIGTNENKFVNDLHESLYYASALAARYANPKPLKKEDTDEEE